MTSGADESLTSTASGTSLRRDGLLTALRWVYPTREIVTVLIGSGHVVGRSSSCDTQLETERVSRKHAVLEDVSGTPYVRDLESKNGVFVNAQRVRRSPLKVGDVVRVGDCVAVVEAVQLQHLAGFRDLGYGILGGSTLARVVDRIRLAAKRGTDLLLVGEPGTGKELLARAFHQASARSGAFVVCDCSAGSEALRAADLFGRGECAAGAAEPPTIGHVRAAQGGTLLLDELLDLTLALQERVAEVMARHEVTPVGEERSSSVDVRFVGKSSVAFDDQPAAQSSRLRRHFEGSMVRVPPLRERRSDILPLFSKLLERHGYDPETSLEPELAEYLCVQDWPFNVRELDSAARRTATLAVESACSLDRFLGAVPGAGARSRSSASGVRRAVSAYPADQQAALSEAVDRHGGNLTKAATELGITRSKAYRMLKNEPLRK